MNKTVLLLGILLIGVILFACSPMVVPVEKSTIQELPTRENITSGKESWEVGWKRTLDEARKEGVVALFGGTTVAAFNNITLLKEKYGIELHITTGRGSELTPKLLQERRAGLYLQDVMITGQPDLIGILPQGAFDPLESTLVLPEVVEKKLWYDARFDWADAKASYIFNFSLYPMHMLVINTDLVRPGEIQSYSDLLNPKWNGKILINDPTVSGAGSNFFNAMVYNKLADLDLLRHLAATNNMTTRDLDLQVDWVARGKYPVALWSSPGALSKFTKAGAPVRPIDDIKEGTSAGAAGSALGFLNKAPHPNAARVFINWFLSKEGQGVVQEIIRKQTRRVDVPTEGLDTFETRRPGVKYFPMPNEKEEFISNEGKKYTELAAQLFAPLLK